MTRRARQLELTFDHEIASSTTDRFAALFAVPFECDPIHWRTKRKSRRRRTVGITGGGHQATVGISPERAQ